MISLLNEPSSYRQPPTSFLASILIHGAVIALVYLAILYSPRVDIHATVHYDMRLLDLHTPDSNPSRLGSGAIRYPGPLSALKTSGAQGDEAAHRPSPRLIPHTQIGPQTLLQPDLKIDALLDHGIPLPKVVLWSASKLPVKKIVAPKPQPPPSADVEPQIDMPNQEVNLADIPLASTSKLAVHELTPASNTTPIVVQQPAQQFEVTPATTTQTQLEPTPAAVMSLSDIRMNDTNVSLPPVNQTTRGDENGSMTAGNTKPLPGPEMRMPRKRRRATATPGPPATIRVWAQAIQEFRRQAEASPRRREAAVKVPPTGRGNRKAVRPERACRKRQAMEMEPATGLRLQKSPCLHRAVSAQL